MTIIGMALIAGSGVFVAWRERKLKGPKSGRFKQRWQALARFCLTRFEGKPGLGRQRALDPIQPVLTKMHLAINDHGRHAEQPLCNSCVQWPQSVALDVRLLDRRNDFAGIEPALSEHLPMTATSFMSFWFDPDRLKHHFVILAKAAVGGPTLRPASAAGC